MPIKFPCDRCGHDDSGVVSTRNNDSPSAPIKRRRRCRECGHTWSTFEVTEDVFKRLEEVDNLRAHFAKTLRRTAYQIQHETHEK